MFDDKFLEAVRNRQYYRMDYPNIEDLDITWEELFHLMDSQPEELLFLKTDKLAFAMTGMEKRASSPQFSISIVKQLKKLFPKNTITSHLYGGLTKQSKSFRIHRDRMDVFYIQLIGDIEWSIWEPNDPSYYEDKDKDVLLESQGKKVFSERFNCGKMIWIPRGTYHLVEPYETRLGISFGVEGQPEPSTYV